MGRIGDDCLFRCFASGLANGFVLLFGEAHFSFGGVVLIELAAHCADFFYSSLSFRVVG